MIQIKKVPKNPGCYIFKDSKDNIIYIGKAKNLIKRVSSYFQKKDHDPKTKVLVSKIDSVEFIVTDTETEALILENSLIKKHSPKYNIDLKDSKRYAYLKLTDEKFPRLIIARQKTGKGTFFGPFVSAEAREEVKEIVTKTFKLRTCKRLPKKECLRYHIGLCDAPCTGKISGLQYDKNIKSAKLILNGRIKKLIKRLKEGMITESKKQRFELALELKKKIEALNWLTEKQKMDRDRRYNEDIINFKIESGKVYMLLFNIYKGLLERQQNFIFDHNDNFFEEFILQYYSENNAPKEIILPQEISRPLKELLKIKVVVPKKGEKKDLLYLVEKNIDMQFFSEIEKLKDLKNKIRLQEIPDVIECFDVSHTSGTNTVASMVQFRGALPDKSNYRRFRIRTVSGVDDYASIAEVIKRRYTRLLSEKKTMPNLIIIDGGKGQLTFAYNEMMKLGLKIPIISIAKKFEEVFVPGLKFPLNIGKKTKALILIRQIRDEAHRFAINYNRLLRKKELIK